MDILDNWPNAAGLACRPLGAGHINDTYMVGAMAGEQAAGERFVLQRMNAYVFENPEGVARNLGKIIAQVGAVGGDYLVAPIRTAAGADWVIDTASHLWRLMPYVADQTYQSIDRERVPDAGFAFGRFLRDVADYGGELEIAIQGFHDLPGYLANLDAVAGAVAGGRQDVELDFVRRYPTVDFDGERRVIHGDCKVNNLLFDACSGRVTHVIDLDTVMTGHPAWDFGDLVRSIWAGNEEVTDFSPLSLDTFRAVATGFARGLGEPMDPITYARAPSHMSFMLGVRFLTDHLAGDRYFKVAEHGQNLARARSQFALTRAVDVVHEQLVEILEQLDD